MFMDTLEKIYERWWGPRLDMILLNALYLLMEKEHAKLPDLYRILSDEEFREMLTAKCRDGNVKVFWEHQYDKMPKDASMAVLTKLYRIVQERILVPIFMAEKSCFDFRVAMDERKIIIVDLPEGVITLIWRIFWAASYSPLHTMRVCRVKILLKRIESHSLCTWTKPTGTPPRASLKLSSRYESLKSL